MARICEILLVSALLATFPSTMPAQSVPPSGKEINSLKRVVVALQAKSDDVIAIPPSASASFALQGSKHAAPPDTVNLSSWLKDQQALSGMESPSLQPWHIVVAYEQFDEDGDKVHSGIYEEYWAGPKRYKRTYKADDFNQTDYATDKGLFRLGDQKWPSRTQAQVRGEILAPFWYAATRVEGFHARSLERTFGGHQFQCVAIERNPGLSDPTQYCFEPNTSVLRYSRGWGWNQSVYNLLESFQGRNIAQEVDVTDGGKRYLELRVKAMETLAHSEDVDFAVPTNAIGPIGGRVSGVFLEPINSPAAPRWPASLRGQHFTVTVEMVIGKNGHVVSARGVSGPPEAYKGCEDAVKKWVFPPYLVLGEPVEVEYRTGCSAF